jgi:hypothetical protein
VKRNLIIFGVALSLLFLAVLLPAGRHSPALDAPLLNPNGYDLLLTAAGMLQGDSNALYNFDTVGKAELAALVATNQEALMLACSALTNECRVPVDYSVAAAYSSAHSQDFIALRRLAFAMTAKGRLRELQNDLPTAAKDYIEVIRFGTEAGRGGFITDAMIGTAIEGLGQSHLEALVGRLGSAFCHTTAGALESLDSNREAWGDVLDREDLRTRRRVPSLRQRITLWYYMRNDLAQIRSKAKGEFLGQQTKTRSLEVQLAARAYELDAGKPPLNVEDLVPRYLKAIPYDPVAGKDMAYPSP